MPGESNMGPRYQSLKQPEKKRQAARNQLPNQNPNPEDNTREAQRMGREAPRLCRNDRAGEGDGDEGRSFSFS